MSKNYKQTTHSKINCIKRLRLKNHLTAMELSKESGINVNTIVFYELDKIDLKEAKLTTIVALCETLDCTIEDLFKGSFKKKIVAISKK